MKNKIRFGLRNVYYSVITEESTDKFTYSAPVAIPGAVNLSLSPTGETNDFYADDIIYSSTSTNQGYEGDLEIALIPESFLTDVMSVIKDANGALIENADAKPKKFALGFEVQGDAKGRRTWLYNCTASRSNQDAATKESSATPQTETITLKAMPRDFDKNVKITLELNDTNADTYNSFFSEVYEKTDLI